jgi:hypothetical protein
VLTDQHLHRDLPDRRSAQDMTALTLKGILRRAGRGPRSDVGDRGAVPTRLGPGNRDEPPQVGQPGVGGGKGLVDAAQLAGELLTLPRQALAMADQRAVFSLGGAEQAIGGMGGERAARADVAIPRSAYDL